MTTGIEVLFLDVGGPIYGDKPYYRALLEAIRERRPEADEEVFWAEFEACRADQRGPFTRRLSLLFVGEDELAGIMDRAHELWEYPPEALQPDVKEALASLVGKYRLGILANQQRWIRDTMARDGIDGFFELWAVSEEVGSEKPDPGIFRHALSEAGVPPDWCAMVGDRLDNDVEASRSHGMKGIWILRGEAPDEPTQAQLARADAAIHSLVELPEALRRL